MALFTALQPNWTTGLPSWKVGTNLYHSLCGPDRTNACNAQHAIAVVGYSPGYLYYVDTCWPGTASGCRVGASTAAAQIKSGMPYVWQVSTSLVYNLMKQQTKTPATGGGHEGGYYFNGSWPWTEFVHVPW